MQNHLELHRYRQRDLERQAENERHARDLRLWWRKELQSPRKSLRALARLAALFL